VTTEGTVANEPSGLGPDVVEGRLTRPDGRTVAWSESGVPGGRPVLRFPGTPGCRWSIRADRSPWTERGIRMITLERPGYGASIRLPGSKFREHADDVAAILDELGIGALPVYGVSGGGPHVLAFAAKHPDRVRAATVVVGSAPLIEAEADQLIDLNALEHRLYLEGAFEEIWHICEQIRNGLLEDPLASFHEIMESATSADHEIIADPTWQKGFVVATREALRPGIGGWYDESLALEGGWDEIDLGAIHADVTWWHSDGDRNCPVSSARRVVDQLQSARLIIWNEAGHLSAYRHEAEILDDLLARA
jgi:pimeloyl-ACP methyl ester carboxylesterase